ncbi:MAG TPA: hypothetical protein VHZ33_14240 [Trebonia sp.]|jgi:hypothetical protein|nr:hypothetical protein [Trebonia sp.]
MPSPAPGADQLAGGVEDDTTLATSARPGASRAWWWAGASVFLLVIVVLFDAYLHLSKTYMENSDEANILLMANDMLHGNVYLTGWNTSDVPFITTELPEITLLVWMFGLHLNTAHIAAAVTYTAVIAVAMLLAKGRTRGPKAITRMALVLAIMLAPQPGIGIFVLVFSVGHIGTSAPVMLTWLVLDRFGLTTRAGLVPTLRQRWYIPLIVAVLLGWALMADPLVLVVAIYPMLVVCLVRVLTGCFIGVRADHGLLGLRRGLASRWLELSLAAAAGIGYLLVWWGGQLLSHAGGYTQQAVPFQLDGGAGRWFMQARVVVHGLLEMFGAYFVPGNAINYKSPGQFVLAPPLSGLDQAIAITRVACVILALWGCCAIARRFFRRDADFISQLLLAGIVLNLAAYIPSTLADHSALNVREVAPVLPFGAVLAARMLGDRLLAFGPLVRVRLPRMSRPLGLRLIVIPLVALFGWYSFGLFRQADTPAAANPFTGLEQFLEANNLSYGLGGYWNASVITVDTGGAITIRAVSPSCMQPYAWENKLEWYDPAKNVANFLLISNQSGYFTSFSVRGSALNWLNLQIPGNRRDVLDYGNYFFTRGAQLPTYAYNIRTYQGNLLTQLHPLKVALNGLPDNQNLPAGPDNMIVDC